MGIKAWLRRNRHRPLREQQQSLAAKLRGFNQYYDLWLCGPTRLKVRNQIIWHGKRSLGRRSQRAYRGSGSCIARGSPYPNRRSFTLRCKRETGEPGAGDLYAGIYGGRGHKTRRP